MNILMYIIILADPGESPGIRGRATNDRCQCRCCCADNARNFAEEKVECVYVEWIEIQDARACAEGNKLSIPRAAAAAAATARY